MHLTSMPRWAILLLGVALLGLGFAAHKGWLRDPSLARTDYVGGTDVSVEDAKLYRAVLPFLLILALGVLLITYAPSLSLAFEN